MSDPFLGQIIMFGGNFAPRGWAFCDGQLLPISQNSALFSIFGTIYGGDGRTTFGLPDLRSRVPLHKGNGPGLPNYNLGQKGGQEQISLTTANMPAHTHTAHVNAEIGMADKSNPTGRMLSGGQFYIDDTANNNAALSAESVTVNSSGGGQPVHSMNPFLAINFIVALQGTFPSRS